MLAELRRARYGSLLALPLLLLRAAGRTPTELAAVLFCSRSTVYRVVRAYHAGELEWAVEEGATGLPQARQTVLSPALKRSVLAILQAVPRPWGWCRTRWSCATIAWELQARRGVAVSAETVRRWWPALGWEWKRAKLGAKGDDPQRVAKLARSRYALEHLQVGMALLFADELDISLLPKVGSQWLPKGTQVGVPTPGTTEKRDLAGALALAAGRTQHCVWYRKTRGLSLDLLARLDRTYPAAHFSSLSVVVANPKIHQAAEVDKGLAAPPRFKVRFLPTYCPKANPIERAFGDVHDTCTRNHTRRRMWPLVRDGEQHLEVNGPWPYAPSDLYDTPEVTAAVQALIAAETPQGELSQLAA
jgi:transposase